MYISAYVLSSRENDRTRDVARAGLSEDHVARAIRDALRRGLTTRQALLAEARRRGERVARITPLYSGPSKGHS